jgi:hypothetical protein
VQDPPVRLYRRAQGRRFVGLEHIMRYIHKAINTLVCLAAILIFASNTNLIHRTVNT